MLTVAIICLAAGTIWLAVTKSWALALVALGLTLEAIARHGLHIN
jgi:hypothetical protein